MKGYVVTFGQDHVHRVNGTTFDCDCVAVVKADTHEEARDKAFELFNGKFCLVHPEEYYDLEGMGRYYPRGKISLSIGG